MISPKYALTHYYYTAKALSSKLAKSPHIVNLYLDYNCPFSAKLFFKLEKLIPQLQQKHPEDFQFVFVNVVQPWHPNSTLLHEYSLVVAQLLKAKDPESSNKLFWKVSGSLFENKEQFYDSATVSLGRNDIYKKINDVVFNSVDLPVGKEEVLKGLQIKEEVDPKNASNDGNDATVDVKYFTRYLRGVGVHVTPTVSVNGIVNDAISSGSEIEKLVEILESYL